jgi:hypothetical protein
MLNQERHGICVALWTELMTVPAANLKGVMETTLQRWTFPDLAMFCLFCAKTCGILTYEALAEMLRISDTDLIKMIPRTTRAGLLTGWFTRFVREKLEVWPPPGQPERT